MEQVESKADVAELKDMLKKHVKHTKSKKATKILEEFDEYLPKFKKIIPADYKSLMHLIHTFEEQGMNSEEAAIEAFNAREKEGK